MYKQIASNIEFPQSAKKSKIEGSVFIEFIVKANGKVSSAKVIKSLHPDCDKEALKAFDEMPNWTPRVNNGKNVKTKMVLPIKFKLD